MPIPITDFPDLRQLKRAVKVKILECDLVSRLKSGDHKAVAILYDNYYAALYGIIKRIVRFDEVAEDVLQDTFVKVWRSIARFDASKGRLFTWLAWTARHTAIDHLRSKHTRNAQYTESTHENEACLRVVYAATRNPEEIGVRALAFNLEAKYSSILNLIYFQGYTHEEAAEVLNLPVGTLKTRLRAAVRILQSYF